MATKQETDGGHAVYQPKNILVTGGAGFIGSHVVLHLLRKYPQYKIVVLDKLNYCASVHNLDEAKDNPQFEFVKGDIASADLVLHVLKSYKIDTILHFAAQTHVDNSFGNSFEFTQTNVMGTHVMLESSKVLQHQIKRFIHVSTDEVYGESTLDDEDQANVETQALAPTNPYAATKAAAEFLVKAYRKSFNLPVIIGRGNNVYGPHQYPEKLIPKFINLLERKKPLCLHGDGRHRRSFIYVTDVATAYDTILHKGSVDTIYNVGTDFEISNLDVAHALLRQYGMEKEAGQYIEFVADRAFNDLRYNIDTSKLTSLGWAPSVGFDEGVRLTIEWYKSHPRHFGNIDGALQPHPTVASHITGPISPRLA